MPHRPTPQERRAALAQAEQTTEWLDRFNPFRCAGCGVVVLTAGDTCGECCDVLADELLTMVVYEEWKGETIMKCPVCKSGLKITDYHDSYILLESESECTVCKRYKERYAYGDTEAGILLNAGWQFWQWSYDTSAENRGRINVEMGQVAGIAQGEIAP